jgi:hypothetical protein
MAHPFDHPNLTRAGLGRPPTGKISKNIRLSPETIAAVRTRAEEAGETFSKALEDLAKQALNIEN